MESVDLRDSEKKSLLEMFRIDGKKAKGTPIGAVDICLEKFRFDSFNRRLSKNPRTNSHLFIPKYPTFGTRMYSKQLHLTLNTVFML